MKITKLTGIVHLLFISISMMSTRGFYLAKLRTHSYTNPSNKCAECSDEHPLQRPLGCCDEFENFGTCFSRDRCDNYFRYCLRPFGTPVTIRGCTTGRIITSFDPPESERDRDTNFSRQRVLGLDNPLHLQGITNQWEGVQIYIEVMDDDSNIGNRDELIDTFAIDIPQSVLAGANESNVLELNGRFEFATIQVSYRILCEEYYYGDFCENFDECAANEITCSDNGQCINQEHSFVCQCNRGFFGQFCQNVDNCLNIDCSNQGQCVNGISSFTCNCDLGYTGEQCEINIDDCRGVNCSGNGWCSDGLNSFYCNCNRGFIGELCNTTTGFVSGGSAGGAVAGVAVIVVVLFILITTTAVALIYTSQRRKNKQDEPDLNAYRSYGRDNPVYAASITSTLDTIPGTVNSTTGDHLIFQNTIDPSTEREFENPLYESTDVNDNNGAQAENNEIYSFISDNGSYYEYLQEDEVAI